MCAGTTKRMSSRYQPGQTLGLVARKCNSRKNRRSPREKERRHFPIKDRTLVDIPLHQLVVEEVESSSQHIYVEVEQVFRNEFEKVLECGINVFVFDGWIAHLNI